MHHIYSLEKRNEWLAVLDLFKKSDVSYLPDYGRVFQQQGEGSAYLYYYEKNGDYVIYPFFLREINVLPYFKEKLKRIYHDITSPYGYAGPVASAPDNSKLIKGFQDSFIKYCEEKNVVTEFVRFHPLLENHCYDWSGYLEVESPKAIVVVDLRLSEEKIWSDYKYSNRKNINRARKEGLEVVIEETPARFHAFREIYEKTMKRRQAKSYYYFSNQFFHNINYLLKGHYVYAHVLKDKEVISTELLLFNDQIIHSFLGGTLDSYFYCRPNNLLKHEVILWAKARGLKYYVLGGGYEENDGIFQYKSSFAPHGIKNFYIGKRVHDKEVMHYMNEIITREKGASAGNGSFFPGYRR